jgi:hypothetical protein
MSVVNYKPTPCNTPRERTLTEMLLVFKSQQTPDGTCCTGRVSKTLLHIQPTVRWKCSARLLAIKPRTFQLGPADWVHLLQDKYATDETLSAVEIATVMSRWWLRQIITRAYGNRKNCCNLQYRCVWISDVFISGPTKLRHTDTCCHRTVLAASTISSPQLLDTAQD